MTILAVEFSSSQRGVAVIGGAAGPEAISGVAPDRTRSTPAMGLIEEVLARARIEREQIDCIAVGLGPGSYTGIRSAVSLAQGWQVAREIRLLGLSSAACLAWECVDKGLLGRVNIAIDAQRNEVYLARYEIVNGNVTEIEPLRLASMAEVRERAEAGETVAGPEADRWCASGRRIFPGAGALARMAVGRDDFVSGEKLEPIYLREPQFVKGH